MVLESLDLHGLHVLNVLVTDEGEEILRSPFVQGLGVEGVVIGRKGKVVFEEYRKRDLFACFEVFFEVNKEADRARLGGLACGFVNALSVLEDS